MQGEIVGEMLGDGALANAALEILHRQHDCIFVRLLADLYAKCGANLGEILQRVIAAAIGQLLGLGQAAFRFGLGQRFGRATDQLGCNRGAKSDVERLMILRPEHDRLDMIAHLLASCGDVTQCVDCKRHGASHGRIMGRKIVCV